MHKKEGQTPSYCHRSRGGGQTDLPNGVRFAQRELHSLEYVRLQKVDKTGCGHHSLYFAIAFWSSAFPLPI